MNFLFSNFENEKEQPKVILTESDKECSDKIEKFYGGFIKEKIEIITTTDEIDDIYKEPHSNIKKSNIEFNENNKKFKSKKKKLFKILNKKRKRHSEKDAILKKNMTIFKKIFTKNINEILEIKNLKKFKLKNK